MSRFEPNSFRQHFPVINNQQDQKLVYFDNGATTQKPNAVIESVSQYYQCINANVHRASHQLSAKSTLAFEKAREQVKQLINANDIKEVIWTKGTTESINLVCQSYGDSYLSAGDDIVLTYAEHHANIVPWQLLAKRVGATIKLIPLDKDGYADINCLDEVITENCKLVACTHVSNVLGKKNPIEAVIAKAKSVGAVTLIDGAQAIAHFTVDVQALDCDFYVFSAHKLYGPTGVGVLYGKRALLEKMTPYQSGGEMIKTVSFNDETTFNSLPFKFEAGTPNIAGVIAFASALEFLQPYLPSGKQSFSAYEKQLTKYCYDKLVAIDTLDMLFNSVPDIGVISFTVQGHHNHDISTALDSYGIAVRAGHHCAMPLMEYLGVSGCIRVSLSPYNSFDEVDYFIYILKSILSPAVDNTASAKQSAANNTALFEEIQTKFAKAKSWDSKHREIMLLGKQLARLPQDMCTAEHLISGCESKAWLTAKKDEAGVMHFMANSDAKVIRGLLVIVLAVCEGKTAKELVALDINTYFESLGLMNHLSPSRGNGLLAIVEKVKALANSCS
ncbi:SufS family cysteine desulfurase [Litorilituus sediminis]|uniref:cysteine desulfurase n=1 Tax=Litorilituus sediminis TaxID=718192 RepID=A0A4P6P2P3_9GAMM|nr:SufS family cysteine desulfurase [Litorilituus sediminis]QBG34948.1 SufS family cysteine desulfurase [Litorilituus sediminis]